MSLIVTKLQGWALTRVAVVLVLLGAYAMGGRAAKKSADKQRDYDEARRAAAGAKGVHDAQVQVGALNDGDAIRQLRAEWMRGDKPKD